MSIQITLHHKTQYLFDRLVYLSPHIIRLRPTPHTRTPILAYTLKIQPETHFINWQQDPFGNWLARLIFTEKAQALTIDVEIIADITVINPFDFFIEDYAEQWPFNYSEKLRMDLLPYLEITPTGPYLQQWLTQIDTSEKNTVNFLVALNRQHQQRINYIIRLEPGVQSCEDTLSKGWGSCRDTGWLLVQVLRHLGLAARFVSGYLIQLKQDKPSLKSPSGEGPSIPDQDVTNLHAWTEVYLPGAGWIGLDPTSGLFAGEGHIPLACTPNPSSAAPIDGFTDPCRVEFSYQNTLTRF